jgi:hypothetical protein
MACTVDKNMVDTNNVTPVFFKHQAAPRAAFFLFFNLTHIKVRIALLR